MPPLENLFESPSLDSVAAARRKNCELYGVQDSPFPSASQTSGHPHMPIPSDATIDQGVKVFYQDRKSQVWAITASQGIGKTNFLNAYQEALERQLSSRGFFVIRYVADPEPTLDPLVRSIFALLGEEHLRRVVDTLNSSPETERNRLLCSVGTSDVRNVFDRLLAAQRVDDAALGEVLPLAQEWMLGLPVRKAHREKLKVQFRLDTIESKTRALRDILFLSADANVFQGLFLLLDELEKQDLSVSKGVVVKYLSSLRALIDALPRYLFMMLALTTDALDRYREMLPALRGRLANEVRLSPLRSEAEAEQLFRFYLDVAREAAAKEAGRLTWRLGTQDPVTSAEAVACYLELRKASTIEGVRQRDFLNELDRRATSRLVK